MTVKWTWLAALAAFTLLAADAPKVDTKSDVAPTLNSAKFWRMVAQAQNLRQQLNESPAGKAAAKADEAVQEAQQELSKACGEHFVLGYGADGDLACIAKPPTPAAPGPVPPPVKKEK